MAKPIPDIPGAANQQLRSLKKTAQEAKFSSKLNDAKGKQLSDEIVSQVLSELQGSDEFTLQLQNKITDIILGRITYSKAESDITQADLDQLREDVAKSLADSDTLAEDIKQAASKCADLVIQSASPSGNPDEVISQIKDLTGKAEEKNEAPEPQEEPAQEKSSEKEAAQKKVTDEISGLKSAIGEEFKKTGSITDKISSLVLAPVKFTAVSIAASTLAVEFAVAAAAKAIADTFKSVGKAVSRAFKAVGDTFKAAKAAVVGAVTAPFKAIGSFLGKLNPFKGLKSKKKDLKVEKAFYARAAFLKGFFDSIDEFVVDFVKRNAKALQKVFKKQLDLIVDQLVDDVISKMNVILSSLAEGIGQMVSAVVGGVVNGLFAPILPLIYVIAGIITALGAAIAYVLIKFPEYAKPVLEAIPKIIDVVAEIVDFVVTKLWSFFVKKLWPLFEQDVWPFIRQTLWPFFVNDVFPIAEKIVDCLINTVWPFLHGTAWEWIKDKLARIMDFLIKKLWPEVHEWLVWLRDDIITPVWDSFVVPLLKWTVKTAIPFIEKTLAPVLGAILEALNTFLQQLKKWIKPIAEKYMKILDWLLDTLYDVLKALEPAILDIVKILSDVFVVVFTKIDEFVGPVLVWLRKQLMNFKDLWNQFVTALTDFEILGCRPFSFMDGCVFDVDKPPPSANPGAVPVPGKKLEGVSSFIQELVNGIVNATDILHDAVKALVYDQVKKKLKNIFKFLKSRQEAEATIDEESLNVKLNSTEYLSMVKAAVEKAERIIQTLTKLDTALIQLAEDICKTEAEPKVDKAVKKTAETDGSEEAAVKKKEAEQPKDFAFSMDQFLDTLFSDTNDIQSANTETANVIESSVATAKENALSFLKGTLMPLVEGLQPPLAETVELLSMPPEQSLKMDMAVLGRRDDEPNLALIDQ